MILPNNKVSLKSVYPIIAAILLLIPSIGFAVTNTVDMVPPVSGVAHITTPGVGTPNTIMGNPLSTDQNLANLLDNNQNTFYQPTAGSNAPQIGSDVLLRFEFPPIPDGATIESVTLRVGISTENTDGAFLMGFGFAPFNRLNTATYLDVDLDPSIQGAFLVSLITPPFDLPPLLGIQVPIPSVFEMNLAPQELSLENVRNLSVALIGVNQSPELFDRLSLVNATVVLRSTRAACKKHSCFINLDDGTIGCNASRSRSSV
jgi:hypothetical protein